MDICCISQVANFAEQIAGSAVDRWVPMDTYNDDLPSFLNDLDIYQRFVPSNNLAPGLFPTGPPGWNNDTGSGHTQAVERFGLLQRSGAQHVALFCLDPDSNAAWEADHWWDLSRKFLDDCGGCYVGTCWTNMTCFKNKQESTICLPGTRHHSHSPGSIRTPSVATTRFTPTPSTRFSADIITSSVPAFLAA